MPGRPILYRTTQNFLRSFGLSSLEELPDLPDASQEDEQLTLDMEAGIARLKEQEQAGEETITDEELEAAARELAGREQASAPERGEGEGL